MRYNEVGDYMKEKIKTWIEEAEHIVFFGGAGTSTESGIPDFRSKDGLYHLKYDVPPEEILSYHYFLMHPEKFYTFYRDRMDFRNAKPNITHQFLAKLEHRGVLDGIITQNIDDLHEKAGSKNVFHLHGSILENHCMKCHRSYPAEDVFDIDSIPTCICGGRIKPDVVLYEEPLPEQVVNHSIRLLEQADLLIIGGTSLSVYPAASFIRFFRGKRIIVINKETIDTSLVTSSDQEILMVEESLGNIFKYLDKNV